MIKTNHQPKLKNRSKKIKKGQVIKMIVYNRQFTEENELGFKADRQVCETLIGLGKSGDRTPLKLAKTVIIDQIWISSEDINGSHNVRKSDRIRSEETLEKGKEYRLDTKYYFSKVVDGKKVEKYRIELNAPITEAEDKVLRALYEPLPQKYRHQIKHRYYVKDTATNLIYSIDFIDEDTAEFDANTAIIEIEFNDNGTKDAWTMPQWLKKIAK